MDRVPDPVAPPPGSRHASVVRFAGMVLLRWVLFTVMAMAVCAWHRQAVKTTNPLLFAVEQGDLSAVQALLDQGADPDGLPMSRQPEGVSPISAAAAKGRTPQPLAASAGAGQRGDRADAGARGRAVARARWPPRRTPCGGHHRGSPHVSS